MAESLCDKCSGLCCRYFALQIDTPRDAKSFDDIRWYLCHEDVVVFVENRKWFVGVLSRCKHLQEDNRCGIYETRPDICRGYSTDNCDFHGGEYNFSHLFTSAEQLRHYAIKRLKKLGKWDDRPANTLLGPEPPRRPKRMIRLPVLRG